LKKKSFLGGCQKWQLGRVRAECLGTCGAQIQQRQNEMNKPNFSAEQQDVKTAKPEGRRFGPFTPSSVLSFLNERVRDLDADELGFLSEATECASHMAYNLADTVSNVGCLINTDYTPGKMRAGNFEIGDNVSSLLFVIADQVRVISELAQIGADAAFQLQRKEREHV
jgi:hypothetical protein